MPRCCFVGFGYVSFVFVVSVVAVQLCYIYKESSLSSYPEHNCDNFQQHPAPLSKLGTIAIMKGITDTTSSISA